MRHSVTPSLIEPTFRPEPLPRRRVVVAVEGAVTVRANDDHLIERRPAAPNAPFADRVEVMNLNVLELILDKLGLEVTPERVGTMTEG